MFLAPVPLTVVYVEIASTFAMCLKPKENTLILHAFDVLDVLVRVFVSSTTLLWIDELGLTSLASRGRIRNSKMKIEILVAFFLSRGRIRNSKKM